MKWWGTIRERLLKHAKRFCPENGRGGESLQNGMEKQVCESWLSLRKYGKKGTKMQVPLLDLKAQYQTIKPELDRAVQSVVEAQEFILGPRVEHFEKEMADYLGVRFTLGVS